MHPKRALTVALLLVAALTGCAGSDDDNGVATAGGTATSSAGAGAASDQEQAVKYARCLREHGVQVADPEDGKPPAIEKGTASDQAVRAAQAACKQYQPTARDRTLDSTQLAKLRQVAKCMREHGFPTFPDPDPDQGGIVIDPDTINTKDPAFTAAQQTCGMTGPPPSPGASGGSGAGAGGDE